MSDIQSSRKLYTFSNQELLFFTESLLESKIKHEEVDVIYIYGL